MQDTLASPIYCCLLHSHVIILLVSILLLSRKLIPLLPPVFRVELPDKLVSSTKVKPREEVHNAKVEKYVDPFRMLEI